MTDYERIAIAAEESRDCFERMISAALDHDTQTFIKWQAEYKLSSSQHERLVKQEREEYNGR